MERKNLLDLPAELRYQIIKHLLYEYHVLKLSLTCKALYIQCQPEIERTYLNRVLMKAARLKKPDPYIEKCMRIAWSNGWISSYEKLLNKFDLSNKDRILTQQVKHCLQKNHNDSQMNDLETLERLGAIFTLNMVERSLIARNFSSSKYLVNKVREHYIRIIGRDGDFLLIDEIFFHVFEPGCQCQIEKFMMIIAKYGCPDILKEIEKKDTYFKNGVFRYVVTYNNPKLLEYIVKDITSLDELYLGLHRAVYYGKINNVRILLEAGAPLNGRNGSILSVASSRGNLDMLTLINNHQSMS